MRTLAPTQTRLTRALIVLAIVAALMVTACLMAGDFTPALLPDQALAAQAA